MISSTGRLVYSYYTYWLDLFYSVLWFEAQIHEVFRHCACFFSSFFGRPDRVWSRGRRIEFKPTFDHLSGPIIGSITPEYEAMYASFLYTYTNHRCSLSGPNQMTKYCYSSNEALTHVIQQCVTPRTHSERRLGPLWWLFLQQPLVCLLEIGMKMPNTCFQKQACTTDWTLLYMLSSICTLFQTLSYHQ